jgi:hypothetical protein
MIDRGAPASGSLAVLSWDFRCQFLSGVGSNPLTDRGALEYKSPN